MATTSPTLRGGNRAGIGAQVARQVQRQGALIALVLLVLFGVVRYGDSFYGSYNIAETLRYNSMFGLIALGMTFVIMTGGVDLSVGKMAALASVLAALLSPYHPLVALVVPVLVGVLFGLFNGWLIAWLKMPPFIVTLGTLLATSGLALIFANNSFVGVDATTGFIEIGKDFLGIPVPVIMLVISYIIGSVVLNYTRFGRQVLAIGGNEEAARLMGLPVERTKLIVYAMSGGLAALAGVILATLTYTGIPNEGIGWELTAIAAVVVGGTLLTSTLR